MTTYECKNCGGRRGFKRNFGVGTVLMILFTFGFWILLMPLYPQHCVTCGVTADEARGTHVGALLIFGAIAIIVVWLVTQ